MKVKIEQSWNNILQEEFGKDYFKNLTNFVREEYKTKKVFPPPNRIFAAFDECPFHNVKVVILGQDPYHGEGQANGLSFSVNDEVKLPPSLQNIYKEIKSDIGAVGDNSGNLLKWARQGVLLLNATLTVESNKPGSHQSKGWEMFTDSVVKILSDQKEDLVFLLWGAYAKKKGAIIDRERHLVLEAAHPSPFSVDKGFYGCKHFSRTNEYLNKMGIGDIKW
jgi:uracil-DNA glycosylase